MTYSFQDGGDGSLKVLVDGVEKYSIDGSEVTIYKNVSQNYVELSDSEHVFLSINTSEVSGATTLQHIVDAIEAALPLDSDGGGGATPDLQAVTDAGFTTSNPIVIESGDFKVTINNTGTVTCENTNTGTFAVMDSDGNVFGRNVAHPDQLATPDKAIKVNGVKCYRALLTQEGTSAPTAVVLENTLGEVPTFSYTEPGGYFLETSGSVFTANKTFIKLSQPDKGAPTDPTYYSAKKWEAVDAIALITYEVDADATPIGTNSVLVATEIEILVYP